MNRLISPMFHYHPELTWVLLATVAFILLSLLSRNSLAQRLSLSCLVFASLYTLIILRFEQRWQNNMAQMFAVFHQGQREHSLQISRELLGIARENFEPDSDRTIEAAHHVGWLLIHTGRAPEAEELLNESLEGYKKLDQTLPDDHGLVCSHGVGNEKSLLGFVYEQTGRPDRAERFYLEALEHYKRRCPGFPEFQKEMTDALARLRGRRR